MAALPLGAHTLTATIRCWRYFIGLQWPLLSDQTSLSRGLVVHDEAFDPSFAAQRVNAAWVDALVIIPPLAQHVEALKRELPTYLLKCAGTAFDHTDVDKFTKDVLLWWANNGKEFPTWALAMQIVGSFTPNSAAAERVFSMLKLMFGDTQMSALMDMIQAALMLKYNGRKIG